MAYTTTEISFEYEQVYDVNTAKDGDSEEDKDSDLFFFLSKYVEIQYYRDIFRYLCSIEFPGIIKLSISLYHKMEQDSFVKFVPAFPKCSNSKLGK